MYVYLSVSMKHIENSLQKIQDIQWCSVLKLIHMGFLMPSGFAGNISMDPITSFTVIKTDVLMVINKHPCIEDGGFLLL